MREFAKVPPVFWAGPYGKALRKMAADGHVEPLAIALYLLTSPHAHYLGLYYLPLGYLCMDTGLSPEGASEGLERLSEAGFCTFDSETDYILVHEMPLWQVGTLKPSDNRVAGIHKEIDLLPDGALKTKWLLFHGKTYFFDALPSPSEAPFKPPIIEEKEKEKEKENPCPLASELDDSGWRKPSFSDFWKDLIETYPSRGPANNKGTPKAREKVQTLYAKVRSYSEFAQIFEAVRNLARWADWKEAHESGWNRCFVPLMSTWVNEIPKRGGWDDLERVAPTARVEAPSTPVENRDYFVNEFGEKIDLLTNRPFDASTWEQNLVRGVA